MTKLDLQQVVLEQMLDQVVTVRTKCLTLSLKSSGTVHFVVWDMTIIVTFMHTVTNKRSIFVHKYCRLQRV